MTDCPHCVLVVDDDPEIRDALKDVLEDDGYEVQLATNGLEALEYLHGGKTTPCLVLLDLMMPVMDGLEFLQNRAQEAALQAIPVTVVSASRQPPVPAGIECLGKPVSLEQVLRVVRAACG